MNSLRLIVFAVSLGLAVLRYPLTAPGAERDKIAPVKSSQIVELSGEPTFNEIPFKQLSLKSLGGTTVKIYKNEAEVDLSQTQFYYTPLCLPDMISFRPALLRLTSNPNQQPTEEYTLPLTLCLHHPQISREIAAKLSVTLNRPVLAENVQPAPARVIEVFAMVDREEQVIFTSPERSVLSHDTPIMTTYPAFVTGHVRGTLDSLESFSQEPNIYAYSYYKAFKVARSELHFLLEEFLASDHAHTLAGDASLINRAKWVNTSQGRGASLNLVFFKLGDQKQKATLEAERTVKRYLTRNQIVDAVADFGRTFRIVQWSEKNAVDGQEVAKLRQQMVDFLLSTAESRKFVAEVRNQNIQLVDAVTKEVFDAGTVDEFNSAANSKAIMNHDDSLEVGKLTATQKSVWDFSSDVKTVDRGGMAVPTEVSLVQVSVLDVSDRLRISYRNLRATASGNALESKCPLGVSLVGEQIIPTEYAPFVGTYCVNGDRNCHLCEIYVSDDGICYLRNEHGSVARGRVIDNKTLQVEGSPGWERQFAYFDNGKFVFSRGNFWAPTTRCAKHLIFSPL